MLKNRSEIMIRNAITHENMEMHPTSYKDLICSKDAFNFLFFVEGTFQHRFVLRHVRLMLLDVAAYQIFISLLQSSATSFQSYIFRCLGSYADIIMKRLCLFVKFISIFVNRDVSKSGTLMIRV